MRAPESFGTQVFTFSSWLADVWALFGDGRRIATSIERHMALLRAVESGGAGALPATRGTTSLLVRLADAALGTPELDDALAGRAHAQLPASSDALLEALRDYECALEQAGLVDAGRAWGLLALDGAETYRARVTLDGVRPSAAQRYFLERARGIELHETPPDEAISRAPEGIEVRFAFPSGRYAEPALLVEEVRARAQAGGVAIVSREPLCTYEAVSPALADAGMACEVTARRPFRATDFGRAFFSVAAILTSDRLEREAVADYLLNPFSGVSVRKAQEFDAAMRADRLMSKESCLMRLRERSYAFTYFEEIVADPAAALVASVFEDAARTTARDEAHVAEQLSAIATLRDVCAAACAFGMPADACITLLEGLEVDVSRRCGSADAASQATFLAQNAAAALPPHSVATLIACDMTNTSYPLREHHDAAGALIEALGIEGCESVAARQRRAFSAIEKVPSQTFIVERCLGDVKAEPTYPAAVVEEFIDCYRDDPTDTRDIDNIYGLPAAFLGGVITKGEDLLFENASCSQAPQDVAVRVPRPQLAHVSEAARGRIVLPRVGRGGRVLREPCLSPSQIESYLECPQKWFALRRLRLDDLDEGFSALEMGDFSHHVLEDFYRRFQADVAPKVLPNTLPAARELMEQVIAEHWGKQPSYKPSSNRLVATSEIEERQFAELSSKLMAYLDREAELLPNFHPEYFEYDIPVEAEVDYAGRKLMGKVDRIDVDAAGRAVIVDYKSSLTDDYDLYESKKAGGELREGKVQALIYAQAVRRKLGLDVVGAIYVSYGRTPRVAGAVDASIEAAHLPDARMDRCSLKQGTFSELLDATEQRIALSLDCMLEGDVAPRPRIDEACTWCPEISCAARRG